MAGGRGLAPAAPVPAARNTARAARVPLALAAALALGMLSVAATADARVFHARDEALKLAFPDADRVETRDVLLTAEQHARIEAMGKAPVESDLVTIYVGWKDGAPFAYGLFDTHVVRTFPETLLVVLAPDGSLRATEVLAFHEPEEYLAPPRWLAGLVGRKLDDDLQVGRGVVAVTGSTLSTRAVTSAIRRAMATWAVVTGGK